MIDSSYRILGRADPFLALARVTATASLGQAARESEARRRMMEDMARKEGENASRFNESIKEQKKLVVASTVSAKAMAMIGAAWCAGNDCPRVDYGEHLLDMLSTMINQPVRKNNC